VLPQKLATPNFYTPPVNLLRGPNNVCGGLNFGIMAGRIYTEYVVQDFHSLVVAANQGTRLLPHQFPGRWRFRTTQSAGSNRVLQGGLIARLNAAARTAIPLVNKVRAVSALFAVFVLLDTPPGVMKGAIKHQTVRFPRVYTHLSQHLTQAISSKNYLPLVNIANSPIAYLPR